MSEKYNFFCYISRVNNGFHFKALSNLTNTEILITSCSASSEAPNSGCEKAFDGNEGDGWAVNGRGNSLGAWMTINFEDFYHLTTIMVRPKAHNFRHTALEFLYGEREGFELARVDGWQTFELDGAENDIITNYIDISISMVWSNIPDGFNELKVFGQLSGMRYKGSVTKHYRLFILLDF